MRSAFGPRANARYRPFSDIPGIWFPELGLSFNSRPWPSQHRQKALTFERHAAGPAFEIGAQKCSSRSMISAISVRRDHGGVRCDTRKGWSMNRLGLFRNSMVLRRPSVMKTLNGAR